MIYWRCYVEDFERDTKDLSMIEDGAYNRLLRYNYGTEKPLPRDLDRVFEIARALKPEAQAAVRVVLAAFYTLKPDGYHNKRADAEIAIARVARENGAKGGRPPVDKPVHESEHLTDDETQLETTSESQSQSRSETTRQSQSGTKTGQPISLSTTQPLNHLPTTLPRAARSEAVSSPSWQAYSTAYETRYGVAPVRNAKVNTALKRFVEAVGAEEAPAIAAFYVTSSEKFYVLKKHPADLLAKDAEKLRTEWATGRSGTETEARQIDRTAATGNVFAKLIDEAEAGPRDGALVEPPNGEDTARWWLDDEALMFQGDEKGVVRVPGQPFEDYIARVLVAMGDGPWMDEQPAAMHNRITFWRAKGFNPPELMPLPAQASAPTRARAS